MVLHIFECSECRSLQKHVTSTPTPLGLSYMSDCLYCKKICTFSFIREGNRKEDWYSNTLRQINRKKSPPKKARRKNDQIDEIAV